MDRARLLILGDGPDSVSGLARIGRDLAWLLSSMPELEVGYLGRGAIGSRTYPWTQYSYPAAVECQWGEAYLAGVARDFFADHRGQKIILTIWDASRLGWFANPVGIKNKAPELGAFLESSGSSKGIPFERWGYFMQDCTGISAGCLPLRDGDTIAHYDRVLFASKWALENAKCTVEGMNDRMDWMPHGIDAGGLPRLEGGGFRPDRMGRALIRAEWGLRDSDKLVGCVMTNQARKHWPVVIEAVRRLPDNVKLWIQTDVALRYWDIPALLAEFDMNQRVIWPERAGGDVSDALMAARYNACDATVLISGGEGFGYPVAESLACGTPVVTGTYGAQYELLDGEFAHSVPPVHSYVDTTHAVRRAMYNPGHVGQVLFRLLADTWDRDRIAHKVEHLDWTRLCYPWMKWVRKGLRRENPNAS